MTRTRVSTGASDRTVSDNQLLELKPAPAAGDVDLLEGLVALTDAIADQAHDRHGIDCLLDDGGDPD